MVKKFTILLRGAYARNGGFTLVETLVAISILVLALTGPLAIISQALKASYFSRDEITASYLAQEPIEFIRNMRDQNTLRSSNSSVWLKGDSLGGQGAHAYDITTDTNDGNPLIGSDTTLIPVKLVWSAALNGFHLEKCQNVPANCNVTIDTNAWVAGGGDVVYGDVTSSDASIYTRTIYLNKAKSDSASLDPIGHAPDRELVITVVVSWNTGGISHNVTVTENLFNWQLENV